ncbi:RagB/SusD family nutrient uptake outer membrane protein [Autumnicola musiva]|uniref:RagB/SusD family nutrient uptake outer membrane protein n=1 Tax=Autumnicola musiva TaxID=3075589 RepID=A0ABU3DAE0_9FLAO|nr:RagB/SusD family nutrient uptake outer membrane protein [Zunongwangia sp. F117]MDT0678492.1 RagB/SusD family nutrient uptake outer membrane protein [Zunongwangia sp. F117]
MNLINKTLTRFLFISSLFVINHGCTDVSEEIYSDATPENFYNTEEEFVSALGQAYANLDLWADHNRLIALQEVTTDEMVVPTRGSDWNDGGSHRRLHRHEWNIDAVRPNRTWNFLFGGISTVNRLIFQFENLEDVENSDRYIAELRGLRALFYWQLIDLFGNVPIVTEFDVPDDFAPETNSREEVFDFIESELMEIEDLVTQDVGGNAYGRINYYTVQAILAKLYLNAEVYKNTPEWSKAEAACDKIINSGEFSLADNFFNNFVTNNQASPEFIFAIPYDEIFMPVFKYHRISLHYENQDTYNLTVQPWNGFSTLEEFYNSYSEEDIRKEGFIVGPQYSSTGERLTDPGVEPRDPDGPPITFTPEITALDDALRQEGARIGKWEIAPGSTANLNNDFAIFRYADILLMKAEARFWQGETTGEALELVNRIRIRAGLDNNLFSELTEENLLAERGRELFGELQRRTDLIRFNKFNDAWWEKEADPNDHVNIFPIPRPQLDANPNLTQNPGY